MKDITQPQEKKPLFASEIKEDGLYHIVRHDMIKNRYVDVPTEPLFVDMDSAMKRTAELNKGCPPIKIE